MTLSELRQYDGTGPDGRICIAVNRKIFDVSKGNLSLNLLSFFCNLLIMIFNLLIFQKIR